MNDYLDDNLVRAWALEELEDAQWLIDNYQKDYDDTGNRSSREVAVYWKGFRMAMQCLLSELEKE